MERPPLATHSITGRAQSTRSSGPKTVTVLPPSPPSTTPTINPKIDSIWRINDPPLPTTWGTAWRGRAKARETAAPSPAGVSHAQCWSPGVGEGGGGGDASKCERRRDQASGVTVSASSSAGSTQRSSVPVETGIRPSTFELRTVSLAVSTSTTTTGRHKTWSCSPRSKNTAAMPGGQSGTVAALGASANVPVASVVWGLGAITVGPANTSGTFDGLPVAVRTRPSAACWSSCRGVHSRFANCVVRAAYVFAGGSVPSDGCGCSCSVGKTPSSNYARRPVSSRTRAAVTCWPQNAGVQSRSSPDGGPASCAVASVPFSTDGCGEINTPAASRVGQPGMSRARAAAPC